VRVRCTAARIGQTASGVFVKIVMVARETEALPGASELAKPRLRVGSTRGEKGIDNAQPPDL
jgi:hypothetical protein